MSLEPAAGALAGWIFLGERLSAGRWGAILCVVAASVGSSVTNRQAVVTAEAGP